MKIVIKQQGGAMPPYLAHTPFVPQSQQPTQQPTATRETKSNSDSDNKLSDKDLMVMMKDLDGLPNDMKNVVQSVRQLYTMQSMFPSVGTTGLVDLYLNALYKAKTANFSKNEFEKAYTRVKDNKGLSEIAINTDGSIFATDRESKQLTQLSVQQYLQNKDRFDPLTNSNILYMRKYLPSYAGNDKLFEIVENGIGLEQVATLINSAMRDLGTSKTTQAYSIYKQNDQVVKGVEVLKSLKDMGIQPNLTIDGLYEGKLITETQAQQAKAALSYLYSMLPSNAKTLLQLKSNNPQNPEQGAINILQNLITSRSSSTLINELDYKGSYNPDGTKNQDKENKDNLSLNAAAVWLSGGGFKSEFIIQDETNEGLRVTSNQLDITKGGNSVGRTTLRNLTSTDFSGILDFNNATMGGLKLSSTGMDKVMTDGVAHSIDLPIDIQAYNKTGIIRPDLRFLKNKQKADQYIKDNNITDKDEINEVYKLNNLPAMYDQNGEFIITSWAKFAVINGNAASSAFSNDDQTDITFNEYLRELSDQDEENAILEFKEVSKGFSYDRKSWWDSISPIFNGHDSIYRGSIFIPVKANMINALMANKDLTVDQMHRLEALEDNKSQAAAIKQKMVNGNDWRE